MTTPLAPEDRPLRWGVLGTGRILDKLGAALRRTRGVAFHAVASRNLDCARAAAREHGAARAYAGYENLLGDPDVEIVLNALHNGLHCDWTIRALEAGKHVLCEKPLGRSPQEVDRMFATARAQHRWLLEGFMYRFHPQLVLARQLVNDGRLGNLVQLRCCYLSQGRERQNPRYRKETGGGVLLDLGCYCVNFARFFAGHEPQRVAAHARYDAETDIDLTVAGLLEFPGGLTAQLACSFETEGLYSADLIGTSGRLHIPHPWRPPAWPAILELTCAARTEQIAVDSPASSHDELLSFILEIEHFTECVRANRPPTYPIAVNAEQDSRANARVLAALETAARTGRSVEVPA